MMSTRETKAIILLSLSLSISLLSSLLPFLSLSLSSTRDLPRRTSCAAHCLSSLFLSHRVQSPRRTFEYDI